MDTSKIIKGVVNSGRYTVTAPIVKEDYGLYLQIEGVELPSTYEVDFSNSEHNGTSVTMIGNSDGVLIPHQFIDTGKDVFAFLYHVGEDFGRTVYKFRIPNKVRPDRTEETPTPEEQSVIDQAISALNEAVAQTAQDKADADVSAQNASADAERAEEARTDAQNYATQAEQAMDDAQTYANNASASATASAQSASQSAQIKADVEDLVDDAQGYAQASAQSASASANSASQAQGYAQSASASASSAQGYASQAQTSANTASTKASEASTSASTASAKATESAQSASQALAYKTEAESAKTASQTAQGLAESARDSAISAKEDAESARDEAQSLVDGISGKVEQIESNTERIESLEDDRYKPYVTDTASGSIASFPDGADDIPLKSLVVGIDPVQDLSSGDPSPENICPISGWEGMQLRHDGKNLFPHESVATYTWGFSQNYALASAKNPVFIKANTEYTLTLDSGVKIYRMRFWDINGNVINPRGIVTMTSGTSTGLVYYDAYKFVGYNNASASTNISTFTSTKDVWFDFVTENTVSTNNILEVGETATDYEPYTGRTIPISWADEAGTVYGGKLDVLSGVMRTEWAGIDLATLSGWVKNMGGQNAIEVRCPLTGKKEGRTNIISNMLKTGTETSATDSAVFSIRGYPTSSTIAVKVPKAVAQDSSEVLVWIANNHPMACYELAEPIEIQLDAHAISSLYGTNNIFADTGDTEVEYRADTKLYIERLTEPDADMIADANITSGQYFMVGNTLYKATANIDNGGQIIVGTNATRVSLAQALNEINV